jgi:hypothetical protein
MIMIRVTVRVFTKKYDTNMSFNWNSVRGCMLLQGGTVRI